jgi:superfamily I DNA/RNA helicase
MQMIEAETRYLTKSWRFGQVIADIATAVLERDMVITGNESIDSKAGFEGVVDRSKPYACLFRTNSALLTAAIDEIIQGTEVAIQTDTKDFVKVMQSALALYNGDGKNVKHDKFLPYLEWHEAKEESENDPEMARIIKIVEEGKAEQWIEVLQGHKNAKNPHVTFTTSHKSKGLQFPQVILGNDFKSPFDKKTGKWVGLSEEEQNLLYVALTRAEFVLEYNKTVLAYIQRGEDRDFEAKFKAALKKLDD